MMPWKPHSFLATSILKISILREVHAIGEVVGIHDRADVGFFHRGFERGQINFAHGALVNNGVGVVAVELGVVAHEVLDRGADALALHAF